MGISESIHSGSAQPVSVPLHALHPWILLVELQQSQPCANLTHGEAPISESPSIKPVNPLSVAPLT